MAGKFNKQPMVTRRHFVGGALATSALAALAGCSGGNNSADNKGSEKVMNYYISEPKFIDPYNAQENQGTAVVYACFDSLMEWDWDTNEPTPLAAADLPTVSEDGLTYTFKLREGMKFHNGDPVDSKSFKRAWERLANPKMKTPSEINYHLAPIAGYEEMQKGNATEISGLACPDPLTFEVTLAAPMGDFIAVCCHPGLAPVPQAALDDPAAFLEQPIGNGAFKLDEPWQHNQYITASRFDDYYGDKPKLDGIYFTIQGKPDTAFTGFEAGDIDFAMIPAGRMKETIKKYGKSEDGYTSTPEKQVLTGTEPSTYYLTLNMNDPVLQDPDVRHAMSLAINRQSIVDTLYEGSREPANGIMPLMIDDNEKNVWKYCKYDPEQAKQILDKNYPANAEGKREIKITLDYNGDGGHEDIMSAVQSDLEAVGIQVTQNTTEWATYLTNLSDGNFQVARMGWVADYPTMDNFLYPNFFSTAANNQGKYNNPEIDAALLAARQIADEEQRREAYRDICAKVGEDTPIIPLVFYAHNYVISSRMKTFTYDAQTLPHFVSAEIA